MSKIIIIASLVLISSCSLGKFEVYRKSKSVEKPPLEFYSEKLEKPSVVTNDRCYLLNSPKTPIVCMLPSEYAKDVQNYNIMLSILKKYQISEQYNRP